ncbi:DUF4249 family protein [Spongiivirga citrea]|uniref:DUF4249 family protein n=1 Tax=Spongiivirga citrea TaxID=1481457 RepID=A0A6M0CIN0_9FLAO|nr:DUF4249 family protein [Spongiivirga citrea]NER15799.1 DUF4249 family protein [Spongiivirga citrea]
MGKVYTHIWTRLTTLVIATVLLSACEDVVEIETPSEPPRLIVDALIRVDITEQFMPIEIRVSETSNFFDENQITSVDRMVIIMQEEDENGTIIDTFSSSLAETTPGSGIYIPDPTFDADQRIPTSFVNRNIEYFLLIGFDGKNFVASTRFVPTTPIDNVEQGDGTIFDEDDTEIIVSFTDTPDREDFYVFDFSNGNFLETEDTFYEGQQFTFSYFFDDNVEPGDELDVSILGADESFYNYMSQLIEQSEGAFGPFSTPVATVRGNIINATNIDNDDVFDNLEAADNFALGYFAIVQEFKETIVVE